MARFRSRTAHLTLRVFPSPHPFDAFLFYWLFLTTAVIALFRQFESRFFYSFWCIDIIFSIKEYMSKYCSEWIVSHELRLCLMTICTGIVALVLLSYWYKIVVIIYEAILWQTKHSSSSNLSSGHLPQIVTKLFDADSVDLV